MVHENITENYNALRLPSRREDKKCANEIKNNVGKEANLHEAATNVECRVNALACKDDQRNNLKTQVAQVTEINLSNPSVVNHKLLMLKVTFESVDKINETKISEWVNAKE